MAGPVRPAPRIAPRSISFLRPTKLIPTDGIVKTTADDITRGATTDVAKARAIYEWIVDNTERNPRTRGGGLGDIRFMLQTKDLTGKCADLNALFLMYPQAETDQGRLDSLDPDTFRYEITSREVEDFTQVRTPEARRTHSVVAHRWTRMTPVAITHSSFRPPHSDRWHGHSANAIDGHHIPGPAGYGK